MRDTLNFAALQAFIESEKQRVLRIHRVVQILCILIVVLFLGINFYFLDHPSSQLIFGISLFSAMMLAMGIYQSTRAASRMPRLVPAIERYRGFLKPEETVEIIKDNAWWSPVFFASIALSISGLLLFLIKSEITYVFFALALPAFLWLGWRLFRNLAPLEARGRIASLKLKFYELLIAPLCLLIIPLFIYLHIEAFYGFVLAIVLLIITSPDVHSRILDSHLRKWVMNQWIQDGSAEQVLKQFALYKRFLPHHIVILELESTILLNAGRYEEADAVWRELGIRNQHNGYHPNLAFWLARFAIIKSKLNQMELSISAAQAAIEINPEFKPLLGNLAETYLTKQLYPERALELTTEDIQHRSGDTVLATHAWALAANGYIAEAKDMLKQAQSMKIVGIQAYDQTHIQYCAGWVAYYAGEKERAKAAFERVQDLPPQNMLNAHNARVAIEQLGLN
jgi:tetratricopeptide (TPR) repeat protein